MLPYVCTKMDNSSYAHLEYIFFDLDGGKLFDYRSRVSESYFTKRDWKKSNTPPFLFHLEQQAIFDTRVHSIKTKTGKEVIIHPIPGVPFVKLGTLWDFYKYIGYEHKKQKWIK